MRPIATLLLATLALAAPVRAEDDAFDAIRKDPSRVGRQKDGRVVVPTNQVLDPAGLQIEFPGKPFDLWLAPNGKTLAVKERDSLILIETEERKILRTLPLRETSFHGLAASPDGKNLFLSRSTGGVAQIELGVAGTGDCKIARTFDLAKAKKDKEGPVPGGLAVSEDGKRLLVCLSRSNTLGVIDLEGEGKEIAEIEVGVAPYGVMVAGGKAYVTNWAGRRPKEGDATGPTSGSKMVIDPKNDQAASGTVSVIDLGTNAVAATIDVGLHPSGMAMNKERTRLYVANANSDTVSAVDLVSNQVAETIHVRPKDELPFGSAPNALDLSPDGRTLYCANGSNNSVAVIGLGRAASGLVDAPESSRALGLIPTGWYPGAVKVSPDGKLLYVANVKGAGSLNIKTGQPGLNSHDYLGTVSVIAVPNEKNLAALTARVHENNRTTWALAGLASRARPSAEPVPVPLFEGERSVFKHVIYIIKENRCYDQVLGDVEKGNGEPELCFFGREVTPNTHALAEKFVLLDNFYCSGILSADGHHWATAAYATDYIEKNFGGFPRSYPYDGDDMLANSAGGFIWDKALAKGLTFRDYGEMVQAKIEPPTWGYKAIYDDFIHGGGKVKTFATTQLKSIAPHIHPGFIGFPGTVPDIMRADMFIKELKEFEAKGEMPNLIVMLLPCDHTMGTKAGRPTPRACVADNDLALGRIVDAVSHSKFWPETVIFATEDDPQAGLDHVDGHRTIALVASPYTKRGAVDSTNYNQTGLLRTIELMLGLSAMNQIDLAATPMANCFQNAPDLAPFDALPNQIPLDEMNPDAVALAGQARYWALKSEELELDEVDEADEETLNRIIWHSVKGYDVAYPAEKYGQGDGDEDDKDGDADRGQDHERGHHEKARQ